MKMNKFSFIFLFIWTSDIFTVETKTCSDKCQHEHSIKDLGNIQHEEISHPEETAKTIIGEYNAYHPETRGKRSVQKHASALELNSTNKMISNKTKKGKVSKKPGKPVKLNKETQINKKISKKNINEADVVTNKKVQNEAVLNKTDEKKTATSPNSNEITTVSVAPILPSTKSSEINISDENKTSSQNEMKNQADRDKKYSKDVSDKNEKNIKSQGGVEIENSTLKSDQEKQKNKTEAKLLGKSSKKNALNGYEKKQKLSEGKDKKKTDDNSIDKSDSKNSKLLNPPKKYKTKPAKVISKNSTLTTSKQKKNKLEKLTAVFKQRHIKTKTAVALPTKTDKASIKIKKNLGASNRTIVKRSQYNESEE